MSHFLSGIVKYPQALVDRLGMYRVVTLALLGLLVCSVVSGLVGWLPYGALTQLLVVTPAVFGALVFNVLLAKLWQIHANHESAIITALILFFLFIPQTNWLDNWPLFAAIGLGLLSKFVLVWRKQHVMNPVAAGAVLLVLLVWGVGLINGVSYNTDIFSWWVSNPTLFWPIVIMGSLVVMKVRKWTLVLWFVAASILVFLFEEWRFFGEAFSWSNSLELFFYSWPALFLAFFMLTEPFTMPPTKITQAFYGVLVGVLMHTTLFADLFPMTPELALVIGNLAVQPFRLKQKLFLSFIAKKEIAKNTYEFLFTKPLGFRFEAGQYLEWMLPHQADSRGERRYFTIASSPTETHIRLALKVVNGGSTYKEALMTMKEGDQLICSQLAGDFLLPQDTTEKLGFIAGGIGVTPFSSHLKYMVDTKKKFDTKLLYCTNTVGELAYKDDFDQYATSIPLETIPVVANEEVSAPMEQGFITKEMLVARVPDYKERHWYLSGPPPMVDAYTALLTSLGVKKITRDFFPGLA